MPKTSNDAFLVSSSAPASDGNKKGAGKKSAGKKNGKGDAGAYTTIALNRKFAVAVLDPKDERRDNIRVSVFGDQPGEVAHHHLRAYEVMRFIAALEGALSFGPEIPRS